MLPSASLSRLICFFHPRRERRIESLALICSLFFAIFCNGLFFQGALAGHNLAKPATWLFAAALLLTLTSLHFLLLALLLNRWTAKPLLYILLLASASAVYFMERYHVYLNSSMMRNILATDVHEASDLLTWTLAPNLLLYAGLPMWFVHRCRLRYDSLGKAILRRSAAILLAVITTIGSGLLIYQDLSSLMRNNRELRFLITPANFIYSLSFVAYEATQSQAGPRREIGQDAQLGSTLAAQQKPVLVVFVLGETVRAANWGLSGYARQTTPRLAEAGVINFSSVSSCGSDTEVSVPCLFSLQGRRHYDAREIRNSQSLLDVIARSGIKVTWLDNQSGCKGVCDGVGETRPNTTDFPNLCEGERCFDEVLPRTLEKILTEKPENQFIVMHTMGNHGPAYYKRYPEAFKHFTPACENGDLAQCQREHIINAYDNAIVYTDHVLAEMLQLLKTQKTHDVALIYVSDHGESLGENGLFLHGLPYAIAPQEQTKVPLVMWLGESFAQRLSLDQGCLGERAKQPAAHDNLFHTVLGLLDIKTSIYEPPMDLSASCRKTARQ